jgi:hypothetical protein
MNKHDGYWLLGADVCQSNVVKEFWALWDTIYDCLFTALDFPVILDGQFTSLYILYTCVGWLIHDHFLKSLSALYLNMILIL